MKNTDVKISIAGLFFVISILAFYLTSQLNNPKEPANPSDLAVSPVSTIEPANIPNVSPTAVTTPTAIPTLAQTSTPTIRPTANLSKRIPLTSETLKTLPTDQLCQLSFNTNPANKTVIFDDPDISFKVPYNSSWGDNKYSVPPYDAIYQDNTLKSVDYGPIQTGVEGCGVMRSHSMTVQPLQSLDSVKSGLTDFDSERPPYTKVINGNKVLFYSETPGMMSSSYAIISGSKHNFIFNFWDEEQIVALLNTLQIK